MKRVSINNWVDEELTRIGSVPKQLLKNNEAHYFEITKNLGWVCLALRHMREKIYLLDGSPKDWDRIIVRTFPRHDLRILNLYASAGLNLHWDMELINKFQALIPAEIIDFHGSPIEPMGDQLRRLGLLTPAQFEHWARTNEDAKQRTAREEEEAKQQIERAAMERAREEKEEKERIAREAKARHEAEVRRLTEAGASQEEIDQADAAGKAAEALDPKYERMLDKLIAQSQGFRKIGILFEQVESMLDLLPRKKVEALQRNALCLARLMEVLNP